MCAEMWAQIINHSARNQLVNELGDKPSVIRSSNYNKWVRTPFQE